MGRRRRLPRILLHAATAMSLALAITAAVLWARSHTRTEGVGWRTRDGRVRQIFSDRGRLCLDAMGRRETYPEVAVLTGGRQPNPARRLNDVTLLPTWRYSVVRPPKPIWNGQDVHAAGDAFPYHRWGLAVVPRFGEWAAPVPAPRLVPASALHWLWEDDYYFWGFPLPGYARLTPTADSERWGVRVVGGERDAPVWTDNYTAFGMGDKAYGFTVAVAWWLPLALFAALPAVRATAAVRRSLRSGRDGSCPA